jgi:predicted nucleotidyltransferase
LEPSRDILAEIKISPCNDPVLRRFRAALDEIYGKRIERVVLFGSRARGDAREDSDYDIAVFLKDLTDRWRELDRLADLGTEILEETGEFIHAMPYRAGSYNDERSPLMHEIRADGVDL